MSQKQRMAIREVLAVDKDRCLPGEGVDEFHIQLRKKVAKLSCVEMVVQKYSRYLGKE